MSWLSALKDTGVSPLRFSMLEVVGRNPDLQQMQLAAALALTRPATTLALDFWEDQGSIERRRLMEIERAELHRLLKKMHH